MEKDEYAKFKADQDLIMARAELAKAYLSKLDKAEIADVSILAAITDWMETGDNSFFEEYCTFRFKKTAEEQKKELEALKAEILEAENEKERLKESIEAMKDYYEEYREYFDKMSEWRKEVRENINKEIPRGFGTIGHIIDFFEKTFTDSRRWRQKFVYVKVGDKLKLIRSVEVADGKVFCTLNDDSGFVLMTEAPEAPKNKSKILYSPEGREYVCIAEGEKVTPVFHRDRLKKISYYDTK